ncbi:aminodeoxychorismate lyase [Sodalis sp. CWE]|uniref:aminodeoxychorismate lyase n=1 Tax=Sodalis sp. CWE TaxID=2803816 RepID=UPI001C7CE3B5|nr:aminodeoxychorismate lyase [Sodalis sp. CWE]MBX4181046.1 aminodeoxychorismate lyase [Sodalis sp. CWE]
MKDETCWINGIQSKKLSLTDRTIHFGDGFFTTTRVINGKIHLLSWHLERLLLAANRLLFAPFDVIALREEMLIAAKTSNKNNGVVKVLISRGEGNRGYSFKNCNSPTRIVFYSPYPRGYLKWRQNGIRLCKSPIRLTRNPLLAGIKHNNRLEQIMIRAHMEPTGADEALVLDSEGKVVECISANLFWRKGLEVFTPKIYYAGVSGVMRRHVISVLPTLGYSLSEVLVGPNALEVAEEVFITNSLLPLASVKEIDGRHYNDKTLYLQLSLLC